VTIFLNTYVYFLLKIKKNELKTNMSFKIIMKKSLNVIKRLFIEYKHNQYVLDKLENLIIHTLPVQVKTWEYEAEKSNIKTKMNSFIETFFNSEITYLYCKSKNMYIEYDGKNYKQISEDNLLYNILEEISRIKELREKKQEIKDLIFQKIKQNIFEHSIPESITIQTIINYLWPVLFKSKVESKHFLCLLGDNILKKKTTCNFVISEKSYKFIKHIGDCYKDYFSNRDIVTNFNRYLKEDKMNRLLDFDLNIDNEYYWKFFIDNFILNLVSVSLHYSNRYDNSEKYLQSKIENRKKIMIFKNKDNVFNLLDYFYNQEIIQKEDCYLNLEEIYYLWCSFLSNENIPFLFKEEKAKSLLDNYLLSHNEMKIMNQEKFRYKFIHNEKIDLLRKFDFFWNANVEQRLNEELEISEIKFLFKNKYKKKCEDAEIRDILKYRYNIKIKNNKTILHFYCNLWDKKESINKVIQNDNIEITDNFIDLYKQYCKYLKKQNDELIVSKSYFLKNIKDIIKEYLKSLE